MTSTTFSERAEARHEAYGKHVHANTARTTCVPEELQGETAFQILAEERQALFAARSRAVKAANDWYQAWNLAQDAATGHVSREVELALENGTDFPATAVDGLVHGSDRSRVLWPYAELLTDAYWLELHICLDAEERARVIDLGREPIR